MSSLTRRAAAQRLSHTVRSISLGLALACAGSAFGATPVFTATQLNVYRDGSSADWQLGNNRLLADGFDDGQVLTGPAYAFSGVPASYLLFGVADGADPAQAAWESGSALHLDGALGAVGTNAAGQRGRSVRLVLGTGTADWSQGLVQSRSFAASIRLSLDSLPAAGQSFGLRMTDGFTDPALATGQNDYVELSVLRDGQGTWVQLRKQDFKLGTITPIGTSALAPVAGAAQLVLSLSHGTPGSDQIAGSYAFANASGALISGFTGLGSATAFQGETYTRLELRATAPVPEPAAWALMAGGLALLGGLRARRR